MARLKMHGVAGTDTESEITLSIDGVVIDHSLINRARLVLVDSTLTLDSDTYPAAWDFSDPAKIVFKLGCGDLVNGRYRGQLVTHDVDHPKGMAWDNELEISIL